MKATSTIKKTLSKKGGWLTLLIAAVVMVFGCYEFRMIDQPLEANTNSSFDVHVVMQQDADDENNFTLVNDPQENFGLLGVLLPEGWTVKDSVFYQVFAADSMPDDQGNMQHAPQDYSNEGYLLYNEDHSTALTESASAPPPGYYWWGARTNKEVDMHFFDSLTYTITIMTDDQVGQFALRYAVGDEDSDNRIPYDVDVISDPMPITITEATSVSPSVLEKSNVSLYPNPTYGMVYVNFEELNNEKVDLLMYDLKGRTVLSKTLEYQKNLLDLSEYPSGTYVMRLTTGKEVITKKFILH